MTMDDFVTCHLMIHAFVWVELVFIVVYRSSCSLFHHSCLLEKTIHCMSNPAHDIRKFPILLWLPLNKKLTLYFNNDLYRPCLFFLASEIYPITSQLNDQTSWHKPTPMFFLLPYCEVKVKFLSESMALL